MPAMCAASMAWRELVLAVAGAVLQPADQLEQLGVQAWQAQLDDRLLARLP